MINVFDLAQNDTQLKKVSSTGGGEWAGSCPMCGGKDRFRVQPGKQDGGRWYCRHCGEGKWHDLADYLMRRNNWKFPEAKRYIDGDTSAPLPARKPAPVQVPQHQAEYDVEVWQARAMEYVQYCENCLIEHAGDDASKWLLSRGITDSVSVKARLGYNPTDINDMPERWGYPKSHEKIYLSHGLIIPNIDTAGIHAIKVRRDDVPGGKKYILVKGSCIWVYGSWTLDTKLVFAGAPDHDYSGVVARRQCDMAFLFESELDALLAYSGGYGIGCLALPAGQHIKPEYQYIFGGIDDMIVMPDADEPGRKHAEYLAGLPHWYVGREPPQGKDISEYYRLIGGDQRLMLDFLFDSAGVMPAQTADV